MPKRPDHKRFMRLALELARGGEGFVEPNPMVGCVIVRNGRVIGAGYHRRFGGPHAEIEALRSCKQSARGATVYVTLEPCCYFGKTPPCTGALIEAGVAQVVAATLDPNPRVSGRGLQQLRRAGIRVRPGVLEAEARALIAPFEKLVRKRRPWVIAKWAQSIDGKIATHTGDSKWISGARARIHAHLIRGRVDAVVIGINTVLADNPELTCRMAPRRRTAARIVLDSGLRIPRRSKLVRTAGRIPTWIFHSRSADSKKIASLQRAGCILKSVPARNGKLSPDAVLRELGAAGMTNVLVEGGGAVLGSWLDAGVIDEIHAYVAPVLIGGARAVSALGAQGAKTIAAAIKVPVDADWQRLKPDWLLRFRIGEATSIKR